MGTADALYAINTAPLMLRGAGQHLASFEKVIQHTIQTGACTDSTSDNDRAVGLL